MAKALTQAAGSPVILDCNPCQNVPLKSEENLISRASPIWGQSLSYACPAEQEILYLKRSIRGAFFYWVSLRQVYHLRLKTEDK